jgi:hypothetical protein
MESRRHKDEGVSSLSVTRGDQSGACGWKNGRSHQQQHPLGSLHMHLRRWDHGSGLAHACATCSKASGWASARRACNWCARVGCVRLARSWAVAGLQERAGWASAGERER